jgi:Sigma-70 factor, region 1.
MTQSQPETDRAGPAINPADLQALIAQGRQRGFVTFEDIQRLIPNPDESIEQIDSIYATLAEAGIPVQDSDELGSGR